MSVKCHMMILYTDWIACDSPYATVAYSYLNFTAVLLSLLCQLGSPLLCFVWDHLLTPGCSLKSIRKWLCTALSEVGRLTCVWTISHTEVGFMPQNSFFRTVSVLRRGVSTYQHISSLMPPGGTNLDMLSS